MSFSSQGQTCLWFIIVQSNLHLNLHFLIKKKSTFVPNCKDIYLIKTPCPVQFWPHFTPSHLLILCLLPSSGSSSFCDYRLFFHLRCTLFHSCCHWSLLAFFSFSYQKELVRLPCQCEFKLRLAK